MMHRTEVGGACPPTCPISLAAWLAVGLLAACSAAPTATPTVAATGPSSISVAVASDEFAVGAPRVPFVLFQGTDPIDDSLAVYLEAHDLSAATPVAGWSGEAVAYPDYDIPYWVAYPEFPHAGNWGLVATITQSDGTQTTSQFAIQVVDHTASPSLGDVPPASENRTLASEPDIAKLSSDPSPDPALYQTTVADALASGRPTVITFATPAFCTSRLCAPVVNTDKAVSEDYAGRVNFIHIEVYKEFDPLVYADEMDQWHLTSEPWTFVLDKSGRVAARLGGPVSPQELTEVLQGVTS